MKKKHCVRIINAETLPTPVLLEILRYAGLLGRYPRHIGGQIEVVYPPPGVDSKEWARMNCARIRSFAGTNAEVVERELAY